MAERRRIVWGSRAEAPQTPDQRAAELLRMVLTPEEQAYFNRFGNLRITGSEGGQYEIGVRSQSGNIRPLTTVKVGVKNFMYSGARTAGPDNLLCAHPSPWTPDGLRLPLLDAIATQVLTIKVNEKHFLKTAFIYL